MLVLKWQKINCLMLYSQKNKCLVLSKYPHSDPLISIARANKQNKHSSLWRMTQHRFFRLLIRTSWMTLTGFSTVFGYYTFSNKKLCSNEQLCMY